MIIKTYTHETNAVITFRPQGRKWEFNYGIGSLIVECKGKAAAFQVANVVASAMKRTKGTGIDGLARTAITRIITPEKVEAKPWVSPMYR